MKTINFIILAFFLSGCSNLLYYPDRRKYVDESRLKPAPQEVRIPLEGSPTIVAWHFKAKKRVSKKAVFVFAHGNGQNISAHFASLYWLLRYDIDYIVFDYPGYGGMDGGPTPENTVATTKKVLAWAREKYPKTPLVAFGQSLGGAVMLRSIAEVKKQVNPCLVVVDSTFHSYQAVARSVLSQRWWSWLFQPLAYVLISDSYAPKKYIESLSPTPLLVYHGTGDKVVNYNLGKEVFSLAKEPKEFVSVPKGQHIQTFNGPYAPKNRLRLLSEVKKYCD